MLVGVGLGPAPKVQPLQQQQQQLERGGLSLTPAQSLYISSLLLPMVGGLLAELQGSLLGLRRGGVHT